MSEKKYFIITAKGEQKGPLEIDELLVNGLQVDTPVWHEGMADWKAAVELPELKALLESDSAFGAYAQAEPAPQTTYVPPQQPQPQAPAEPLYFAMIAGVRVGPLPVSTLIMQGLTANTPVWREGMANWTQASMVPEVLAVLQSQPSQPYYQQPQGFQPGFQRPGFQPGYQQPQGYQQPGYQQPGYQQPGYQQPTPANLYTNWLPWAILGTVLGLCSCIGMILGIIGIVNANKANNWYNMGDQVQGDHYNGQAKTFTIISLVFDGIGMGLSALMYSGGLMGGMAIL